MRMVDAAGIGTYLRHVVPGVLKALPDLDVCLLGKPEILSRFLWSKRANVRIIECRAPIYSIREQIEVSSKIPTDTSLHWSPHYNIPLLFKGPLLVTVHDAFHLSMPEFVKGWHRRTYSRVMFRAVRSKATGILCVSRFAKDELMKFFPNGPQNISVVHNGVDTSWFHETDHESPHQKPYLLFVGNVKPHKNIPRLLDAFGRLLETIPHDLVIIGRQEGFLTGDPIAVKKASGMRRRVVFVGELDHSHDLLRRYYSHADVLILPSLYESFGLPALEAIACRCPVIVSRIGGMPEVYGDAALYCDPYDVADIADGIFRMVTNHDLRRQYVEKGVAVARAYSWEKAAEGTGRVIQELLV
jgi:glycosyltransferase involved in cell wall biosynthesis